MNFYNLKRLSSLVIAVIICLALAGCTQKVVRDNDILEKPEVINSTIGEIADIRPSGAFEVHGFGLVAGLNGTGSRECPPDLRRKLVKEIKVEMTDGVTINADAFINSKNTAVVEVFGVIPTIASKGDFFDIRIAPLSSSQTTSLENGYLYTTKLVEHSKIIDFGRYLKTQAYAKGPIFINKFDDRNPQIVGDYVLGGGRVIKDVQLIMILRKQNYFTASLIRNMINEKFGEGTADAKSAGEIVLKIPKKYSREKQRFLAMVRFLYLGRDPELIRKRTSKLVSDMANNKNKLAPEIALEVMGLRAIEEVAPLLNHHNEQVRFHAARCMLNNRDDRALTTLIKIIKNPGSPYRIDAIKTIGRGARKNNAITILSKFLDSEDFDLAMAAYDELRKLRYVNISRYIVADDFLVDTVMSHGPKRIYVNRTGTPKIIIFGEPLKCNDNIFLQSENEGVTINSRNNDPNVLIWRKNPKKPGVIGPLKSSRSVRHIIHTLGESPRVSSKAMKRPGLAVPYYEIASLLQTMCKSGNIDAEFILSDIPEFPTIDKPALPRGTVPDMKTTPEGTDNSNDVPDWKKELEEGYIPQPRTAPDRTIPSQQNDRHLRGDEPDSEDENERRYKIDDNSGWKVRARGGNRAPAPRPRRRPAPVEEPDNSQNWRELLDDD